MWGKGGGVHNSPLNAPPDRRNMGIIPLWDASRIAKSELIISHFIQILNSPSPRIQLTMS
jgi:hypothetical protein